MSDKPKVSELAPPPHINAEPHRRLMEYLASLSEEERARYLGDASVRAGIYTPDDKLTEHYRDSKPLSLTATACLDPLTKGAQ